MSLSSLVPTGYVLTSGANSALTWTNAVSVSSISASTLNAATLNASNLTVSTLATSSSVTASTLTTGHLNYSSIVGSSISSNAMTLSLTNASTQNTQIYQVATTNPTTSYTAIQASHVSTGTTNNALALNPSGGNVGVGTTTPTATLHALNPTPQAGNTTMVTAQIIGRPFTGGVQDGTSCGFAIGAISAVGNSASRMDVMVAGTTYAGNNFGYTPDIPVATFLGSGNVGIGATAPGYKLEVNGVLRSMGTVGVTPAGATTSIMHYWWTGSQFAFSADNVLFYYISPNSDYRIKENIQTPSPILNRLCAVNMIEYEFKTNGIMKTDGKRLGVFAHELQEAFPEYPNIVIGAKDAVNEDGSIRIQSISGEAIGYLVMKAVQELATETSHQATSYEMRIQELSTQLAAKSAALDALIAWAQTQGYSAPA